jgi:hypothetical protein
VENLPGMPGPVGLRDRERTRLRAEQRVARESDHLLAGRRAPPDESLGNHDQPAVADTENAPVHCLSFAARSSQSMTGDHRSCAGMTPWMRESVKTRSSFRR